MHLCQIRNIICVQKETLQSACHPAASSGRKQFILGGGGSCFRFFPGLHIATPCRFSLVSGIKSIFFSRKLEEGFIAVSKPISCIACAKRLIAVSLRLLLRLSQNVTLSIAKYCAVEKTGANRTWETLFVQNLNNILCQNKCDNGLLFLAP